MNNIIYTIIFLGYTAIIVSYSFLETTQSIPPCPEPPMAIQAHYEIPAPIQNSLCNLNQLISEGKISTTSDTSSTQKYLYLKPPMQELDKAIASTIFESNSDYQKFYLLEKQTDFSSFIYRYDMNGFTSVYLTTITNTNCELIDHVLIEERDVFEEEQVGTTSIQVDTNTILSTFYDENSDYNNWQHWEQDSFKVQYQVSSNGEILEFYENSQALDSLEI